ncbi:unnamed protein product [Urochloa decumbens]|uniref:FBD domain-containing protein n=1 Tax=Urochloa decumbens TaxID=240449 RepID=A0ABC9G9D1_9POAL
MDEATRSRSQLDNGGGHPPTEASPESATGGEDDLDLISCLPDCILGEIVTRLPAATAATARIQTLSSRWRHAWSSSPLNLDLDPAVLRLHCGYDYYGRLISALLSAHRGAARRLKLVESNASDYNLWLQDPALNGLHCALRFAPTLRVLKLGRLAFPSSSSTADTASLRFPRLELLSFVRVDISEGVLHRVLVGCPVLKTLVLDACTGFARVRITSPTVTSFAISASKMSYGYMAYLEEVVTVRLWQVVVEDAPLPEKLVPFREELELGAATVFDVTSRRVNLVTRQDVVMEKRSLMRAVMLATTLPTVKVLAIEDVDCVDDVGNFLRCFPRLEKIYVSVSTGFKSVGSYRKLNPIECLEHHLKMVAINGYEDKRSHVKLANFFLRSARVLQLMKLRSCRGYYNQFVTKGWIADQRRQLQVRNMASHNVKFHFVPDRSYQDVFCGKHIEDISVAIHDSSTDDPYHQWFES